jgi:hypothetical protein
MLTTNVSFVLSKKLKDSNHSSISPKKIADSISKFISNEIFEASVDGGGFININPTNSSIRNFFNENTSPLNQGEIKVDWNAGNISELVHLNEEAVYFIGELVKRGTTELSRADSLLLLSLLADVEIDANSYLRNFIGRDNTPQYLKRFEEISNTIPDSSSQLQDVSLTSFKKKLLLFQGRLSESIERDHPERVFALVLGLVREFFSVYNQPAIRQLLLAKNGPIEKNWDFLLLARSCRKQVLSTLNMLKFSCELPRTVL